jgi:Predicted membrane protein
LKYIVGIIKRLFLFIKKNYIILLSFLIPALILEVAYIIFEIYPFGKRSLLIIDLYHQYAPFLSDFQDKLKSFSSMLYSWAGGLGTSYLPLFAYYVASPLNLLTVLFPKEHLTEAVLVLTLLKIGLAGMCFTIYLKGIHREQNFMYIAFSSLYALSGYVLTFSWNIMWMDAIYLLPLIMLGLVRLVRDSKGLFYCIALAIALFSNFYMAIFICIFSLLYYPVCLFSYQSIKKPKIFLKASLKFAGYSLLAAGLSTILLLPTYLSLKLSSAADDRIPSTLNQYFDLFDFVTRHYTVASPAIREGMPNLYCGIIVLILIPIYFMSKSIRLKEKFLHLVLILVLIASFNTNVLNFIWHGFHFPNQIPYRFSFVYIFFILSMGYKAFKSLQEFSGKQIGIICTIILTAIVISQKFDDMTLDYFTLYISIVFIIFYAAAMTFDKSCNFRYSYKLFFIFMVIIAEVTTNTILTVRNIDLVEGYSTREGYSSGKEVRQIREQITSIEAKDKGFYRLEILPARTTNDAFLYNYRGLSLFSSTSPMRPVKMFENLGYSSNSINSYKYEGSTPILDSIFGIKYLIFRSTELEENLYKQTAVADKLKVYENPYALSLGFQAPADIKKFHSYASNPFDSQNNLVNILCGVKDILTPVDQKAGILYNMTYSSSSASKYYSFKRTNTDSDSTARVQFTINKDQQVYLYYKAPYNMKGSAFVMVNDKKIDFNPRHSTIINLGYLKSGTKTEMTINFEKTSTESGVFEVYSCGLDKPAFEKAMALLSKNSMTIESFKDTDIRGSLKAEKDGVMVMSIPYDKGWHVMVDNKEVKTEALDNCLLSFDLSKGTHSIELRFLPDKFMIGFAITLVSLLILLSIFIFTRVRNPRRYQEG